jgi:hypothetical protein
MIQGQQRKDAEVQALDRKYFSTTQNYTLALLNAFDNLWWYVQRIENGKYVTDKAYKVPITFGNYEKANVLEDLNEKDITSGNFNFLPRMVLTFNSMTKAFERQTQKYQRFSKRVQHPDDNRAVLDVSYNSIPYDFQFTLLLQARGMTMATQLTEQILSYFNPSMNLNIREFPLFTEMTQTQIQIQDPEFEIINEFEDTDVNIINVTFGLTIRGNIYSQIGYEAPLEILGMFIQIWDDYDYQTSKMASYYKFDQTTDEDGYYTQTERHFVGTKEKDEFVDAPLEEMEENRPDFNPPEIETKYK